MHARFFIAWGIAVLFVAGPRLRADVQLPALFGDHMVLQEDMKLPIWGTAAPGEMVTVTVGGETGNATAGADGKWRVELAPLPVTSTAVTMTVSGKNSVTFNDVLIGDVWVCSGQSNMEFGIKNANDADTEIPQANQPEIRLFFVPKKTSLTPLDEITLNPAKPLQGHWQVCTPETIVADGDWGGFTAVGYFFGREIQQKTGHPIGLIASYWGGTPAQAWTSVSGLEKDPSLKHHLEYQAKVAAGFDKATQEFAAKQAAFETERSAWTASVAPSYMAAMKTWNDLVKADQASGQTPPPRPQPSQPEPRAPNPPDGGPGVPANLYNGMIAPLISFGIKGVIWYQGEANADEPLDYRKLFPRMITDWREKWNEGDFPFLFVQLASHKGSAAQSWPFLRESQAKALSLPNTGMATAVDIGNVPDVHPRDKIDVGQRLALVARHVAYGEKLVYSGPVYQAMEPQGDGIALSFTHVGGGLIIGSAPWVADNAKPIPTDKLVGFVICGDDHNWVPADAEIKGDQVIVSNAQVPKPVAVRYAWSNIVVANLYNKANLPAMPFRTDDWPDPAAVR
jgi:sialate O-acetylesterase